MSLVPTYLPTMSSRRFLSMCTMALVISAALAIIEEDSSTSTLVGSTVGETQPTQCYLVCLNRLLTTAQPTPAENQVPAAPAETTPTSLLDECMCPQIYQPICGSDGTTYGNQCLLDCHNRQTGESVEPANEGPCEVAAPAPVIRASLVDRMSSMDRRCNCPRIYRPICGSDGRTYGNRCLLDCHNRRTGERVRQIRRGPCWFAAPADTIRMSLVDHMSLVDRRCNCPRINRPICGSNGRTYGNRCLLDCHNRQTGERVRQVRRGPCRRSSARLMMDDCICTREYNPVCGSDGNTYSNVCELDCNNRRTDQDVKVAYNGACTEASVLDSTVEPLGESGDDLL